MSKYLKLYDNESQYLIAQSQQDFTQYKPNVVYCIGENKSHYNNIQSNDDISQDEQYIIFEDPEVRRICSITWGDYRQTVTTIDDENNTTNIQVILYHTTPQGKQSTTIQNITRIKYDTDVAGTVNEPLGITFTQAAAVTNFNTAFRGNTLITSLNELKYFTHVSVWNLGDFNNMSNLKTIILPSGINQYNHKPSSRLFENCTSLQYINMEDVSFNTGACQLITQFLQNVKIIIFSKYTSELASACIYRTPTYFIKFPYNGIVTIGANNTTNGWDYGKNGNPLCRYYVPDNLLEEYKTDTSTKYNGSAWSTVANRIFPISQFDEDTKNILQ